MVLLNASRRCGPPGERVHRLYWRIAGPMTAALPHLERFVAAAPPCSLNTHR